MSAHTPGPWTVFSNSVGVGVTSHEHDDVAHCGGFNSRRLRAEEEANACLIAAAPEMLEALIAQEALYQRGLINMTSAEIDRVNDLRRAAIAKATAEQSA